jgi:3-phosphoshikimate 1-carboxyvinyltransferase
LRVPGSKSISNRAILLASLASGRSQLFNVLHSEDTVWMLRICRQLGAQIYEDEKRNLIIDGVAGRFQECKEELYVGNAGTCARFLCAALTRGTGSYVLRGNTRMHERPMSDLIHVLRLWGVRIECLDKEGFLPLRVYACKALKGGNVQVRGNRSSQFLSALLMLAPFCENDVELEVEADLVSPSYVAMTRSMMKSFAVEITSLSFQHFCIPAQQKYRACDFKISGDASSASYFFALAAIMNRIIRVEGLEEEPVQSDLHFVHLLEEMGAKVEFDGSSVSVQGLGSLKGIQVDMKDCSDVVPTLAIVALFAEGKTLIRNVAHMREKECDRISALVCELRRLGARVSEYSDGLSIEGPIQEDIKEEILIRTYNDHRIAMSFAILAKRLSNVTIENPDCVCKTYPNFFNDLKNL